MKSHALNRRQFLRTTVALAGTAMVAPWAVCRSTAATTAIKRTAADQVTLGKTGIKLSRLGIGTGVNAGANQVVEGKEAFIRLVRHAYDQGITYIDTAQRYQTFGWIGESIKGLPREKLFIQSKVPGQPADVLAAIDSHRKAFNTDYIDSLLIHCMTNPTWTDQWKKIMDGFNEAKDRKWILSKGVSCHRIEALRRATESDWTEVHLVRVNPMGAHMDDIKPVSETDSTPNIAPVIDEIKSMHAKGRGVIGMKIFGNGDFRSAEQREKSMRYAMSRPEIHSIVIGFETTAQIDETVKMMNSVLAET